jgi:Kef-type K+ transport system membrane component KefB
MGGLLGAVLRFIDESGGNVLLPFIGKEAAMRRSKEARRWRLVFGSLLIGVAISAVSLLVVIPTTNSRDLFGPILICLVIPSVFTSTSTQILENLNQRIEKDSTDRKS